MMIARLTRMILALAVMVMPFGMGQAAAAPVTAMAGHSMTAIMAGPGLNHCPGHSSNSAKGLAGDCTMACSAALPAAPLARHGPPVPFAASHGRPSISARLPGLVLEIATPPPRIA